jgi:uncharacterized membrane protein
MNARAWRIAGLALVFVWFFVGGIGHFVLTNMFASVVPTWVPMDARSVVLATGACEIAGALALLHPKLRRLAGWALIAFTICVTPVHIEMLQHRERYQALGDVVLWVRLLIQPALMWVIWMATGPGRRD